MIGEELLNDLYYKQHNYDNAENLYQKAKPFDKNITLNAVKQWLSKQQNKQQTFKKVGSKSFLPIYSETPYSFQLDLTFFPRYKKYNNNNYVLFTAININTRYAYAYYGKDKNAETILDMLKRMEKQTVINSISCDAGTEFKNTEFIKYCNDNNIELYFIKDDSHKLGIINRFHRTLKDKLTKYFLSTDTFKWIDAIDKIIHNYNHTVNRGIGIEPYKVNNFLEHEIIVWKRSMTDIISSKSDDFKVGDKVRILNKKVLFEDKMLPNYSATVFTIEKVMKNSCIIMMNDREVQVKKSQLILANEVQNVKVIKEIPRILKEDKVNKKIAREKLDGEVLEGKRIKKVNKKYFT